MRLTFLGVLGGDQGPGKTHHMATLLEIEGKRVLLDYGRGWTQEELASIAPDLLLITHAHPDHYPAPGEVETDLPVGMTEITSQLLPTVEHGLKERVVLEEDKAWKYKGLEIVAYPVTHSTKAPAAGFTIQGEAEKVAYFPDVLKVTRARRDEIFHDLDAFIGSLSAIEKDLARGKRTDGTWRAWGHASTLSQIKWGAQQGFQGTFAFTHYGKEALALGHEALEQKIQSQVEVAYEKHEGRPQIYIPKGEGTTLEVSGKSQSSALEIWLEEHVSPFSEWRSSRVIHLVEDASKSEEIQSLQAEKTPIRGWQLDDPEYTVNILKRDRAGGSQKAYLLTRVHRRGNVDETYVALSKSRNGTVQAYGRIAFGEAAQHKSFKDLPPGVLKGIGPIARETFKDARPLYVQEILPVKIWTNERTLKIGTQVGPGRMIKSWVKMREGMETENLGAHYDALYLMPPHGRLIAEGEKDLIVKPRAFPGKANEILYLVSGRECFGRIRYSIPEKISLKEFEELRPRHRISSDERLQWWPEDKEFWKYEFEVLGIYKPPLKVEIPKGSQIFVKAPRLRFLEEEPDRELVEKVKKSEVDPEAETDENTLAPILPSGDSMGKEIELEDVLQYWLGQSFFLSRPHVYLTGGIVNNGSSVNDIEILIMETRPQPHGDKVLEFRIARMLPEKMRHRIHFLYDEDRYRPFTSHVPLWNLKVEASPEARLVKMEKAKEKQVKKSLRPQKCHYCDGPATFSILWAEGKAYVPVCSSHKEKGIREITKDYGGKPDAVRPIVKMEAPEGATDEERECIKTTQVHIDSVGDKLSTMSSALLQRGRDHDASKLQEPELPIFVEYTPKLKGLTYGSAEYKKCLAEMKPALDHHYEVNSHHPEFFGGDVGKMNLVDLVEMLCDWIAATERHADGNIEDSFQVNAKRFGLSDQLLSILKNSVVLFPKPQGKQGLALKEMAKPFGSQGGKHFQVKWLLQAIPDHKVYVEPFCGGASLFFAKAPAADEILNDRDSEIVHALKWLRDASSKEFAWLRKQFWSTEGLTERTEEIFKELKAASPEKLTPQRRTYRQFFLSRFSVMSNRWNYTRSDRTGSYEVKIPRFLVNLEKFQERLKGVTILQGDWSKTLKYDSSETFYYLDPLYSPTAVDKQTCFNEVTSAEGLAKVLRGLKGKYLMNWIRDDPKIRGLFRGSTFKIVRPRDLLALAPTMAHGRKHAEEYLISNFGWNLKESLERGDPAKPREAKVSQKEHAIDVEVIARYSIPAKGELKGKVTAYSYFCGLRDPAGKLVPVGYAFNFGEKLDAGDILRVRFRAMNMYTDPETGRVWFTWWAPKPLGWRKDIKATDTTAFAKEMVEKTQGEVDEKPWPKEFERLVTTAKFSARDWAMRSADCILLDKEFSPEEKFHLWESMGENPELWANL